MKSKLNKSIRQFIVGALCALWLAGESLPAQDTTNAATNAVVVSDAAVTNETAQALEAQSDEKKSDERQARRGRHQEALVVFGHDAELKAGETADAVVVIGGNATVKGKVRDAAVVIGGDLTISGEVDDAAVAVMGNVILKDGAHVRGDAVSVGGTVDIADGATVDGQTQAVDFGAAGLPQVEWLRKWFVHCVVKMRLLAPQVGWVWAVAGIFFLFYVLTAVALPKPVQSCAGELTRRPATTFFMGLVTAMLMPIVLLILIATGIGVFIVPFVLAALLFGALIGKAAFLAYLGQSVRRAFGVAEATRPIIPLVIGSAILAVLYMVPVLGLIIYAVTGMWGLGAAVTAAFGSMKREAPERTAPPPAAAMTPMAGTSPGPAPMPVASTPMEGATVSPSGTAAAPYASAAGQASFVTPGQAGQPQAQTAAAPAGAMSEALIHPRAGFFERMGAGFLDVVLVGILSSLVGGPPLGFLVALAYFAGMWAWKGTTVGGIVLNLKVVRLDGSPVTFAVALVRGLAAAFSVIVMFLGFLWIAWDKDKQGWHDRIAGTVVVRLPRGVPLVCL